MARARNIKPGFFTNDVLAECSPLARLLFAGLWLHADREGRLEDRPRKIKAEILPYDSCEAEDLLGELQARGFIVRYAHQGGRYIQVTNFGKHQNPHVKEAPSEIPAPDEHSASPVQNSEIPERAGLIPSSLIPHPDSLIPQPATPAEPPAPPSPPKRAKPRAADWADDFEVIWAAYPRKPGMSRSNTEKVFAARIAEGAKVPAMLAGVEAYAAYVLTMGTEAQFIKSPETFFGPGKHWESDWTPPPRASPPAAPQQLGKAGQATARNMESWLEKKLQEASNA